MSNPNPFFDPTTLYQIEVQGIVNVEWLQSFHSSVEIIVGESDKKENTTLLQIQTDQSGIAGLVRRLHGLGITIQQIQIITPKGE